MSPVPYLDAYRRQRGMTVKELADYLDYDPGNMWRMFNREQYEIRATTACRFAMRLGVSVEVLMGVKAAKKEDEMAPVA